MELYSRQCTTTPNKPRIEIAPIAKRKIFIWTHLVTRSSIGFLRFLVRQTDFYRVVINLWPNQSTLFVKLFNHDHGHSWWRHALISRHRARADYSEHYDCCACQINDSSVGHNLDSNKTKSDFGEFHENDRLTALWSSPTFGFALPIPANSAVHSFECAQTIAKNLMRSAYGVRWWFLGWVWIVFVHKQFWHEKACITMSNDRQMLNRDIRINLGEIKQMAPKQNLNLFKFQVSNYSPHWRFMTSSVGYCNSSIVITFVTETYFKSLPVLNGITMPIFT